MAPEDEDPVGPLERGRSMRHEGDGELGPASPQIVPERRLGLGVERGGRVVEHEDPRPSREGASERDALLLTSREREPASADEGVDPVSETAEVLLEPRGAGGLDDGLVVDPRAREADVLADRPGEQDRLLRHVSHLAPQGGERQAREVCPVQNDPPGARIDDPGHEPQERALPRADASHDGDRPAGIETERDVRECAPPALLARVRVRHVLEPERPRAW